MIGGSQQELKGGYQLLTGIGEVNVITVNPTKDEYKEITGNELPYDLNYGTVEFSDAKFTPLKFLVFNQEYNKYDFVNMLIGHTPMTTRDGSKFKFIDKLGQITYFAESAESISNNPKVSFYKEIIRKILPGEEELHHFLQSLIRYSSNADEANWTEDVTNIGITPENLIKGDVTGIRKLLDFATQQGNAVGVVYTVQSKEKLNDEGEPTIRYYQDIAVRNHPFFWIDDNGIPNGAYKHLKKLYEEGEASGYPLFRDRFFTFKLQPFVLEECYNYGSAPDAQMTSSPQTNDVDSLLGL